MRSLFLVLCMAATGAAAQNPTFGDLTWGMEGEQAHRALTEDGWSATDQVDLHRYYRGTLLEREAVVVLVLPPASGLMSVSVTVSTDLDWDTAYTEFWTLHQDLASKYGRSTYLRNTFLPVTHSSDRAKCEALANDEAEYDVTWPDSGITLRVDENCDVAVIYRSEGYAEWFQSYTESRLGAF